MDMLATEIHGFFFFLTTEEEFLSHYMTKSDLLVLFYK